MTAAREASGEGANLECVLTEGSSMPAVDDASVDSIWSFDVFVHIRPGDQAGYLDEVARVLKPGGVAAIHHADGRNRGDAPSREGWRAPMSATLFASLARDRGLTVEQQMREWSGGRHDLGAFHDVITVLRKPGASA